MIIPIDKKISKIAIGSDCVVCKKPIKNNLRFICNQTKRGNFVFAHYNCVHKNKTKEE